MRVFDIPHSVERERYVAIENKHSNELEIFYQHEIQNVHFSINL